MIAQNVAAIVADHVRLTVEAIDRMYLNVYVPRLQCAFGVVASPRTPWAAVGVLGADGSDEPRVRPRTRSFLRPAIGCPS
jgi:hypothetical protein